ncbi:MAG: hypothetical protein K2J82_05630 [Muribaculaceae bacterium]|nr:hypothetical protein [Muribaculaceae bacterium]MDE6754079.1 hypothetical protein [Muribaculaceae bacterium]
MAKGKNLKEGQIYAIPLSNGTYTIAQLINHHIIVPSKHKSENTFAFFNLVLQTLSDLEAQLDNIDLSTPVSILTANSSPKVYNWILIGEKNINIVNDYKHYISSLGLFKNRSTDPSLFLEPYFGLFPWDGYAIDTWIEDRYLLPNSEIRKDIKYIKDFTLDELTKLLPADSPKLRQLMNINKAKS